MLVMDSARTIQRCDGQYSYVITGQYIRQTRTTVIAYTASDFQDQRDVVSIFAVRQGWRVGLCAARNRRRGSHVVVTEAVFKSHGRDGGRGGGGGPGAGVNRAPAGHRSREPVGGLSGSVLGAGLS